MYKSQQTPYLQCVGVRSEDDEVIIDKHFYLDGKFHEENSSGLCPDCTVLTKYIRRQYSELIEHQMLDCKLFLKYNNDKPLTNIEEVFLTRNNGLFERITNNKMGDNYD